VPTDVDQNAAVTEYTGGVGRLVKEPSGLQVYDDIPLVFNTYNQLVASVATYNQIPESFDLIPGLTETAGWKQQEVDTDGGSISETATVRVVVASAETGTGYDTASPGVRPLVTDSNGSTTDIALLNAKPVVVDSGLSAVEYTAQAFYAYDSATAVEVASVQEGINDFSGPVTETGILHALLSSADTAVGSEVAQGGDFIEAFDTATGIESAAITPGRLSDGDAGQASEIASITVALLVSDAGVIAEVAAPVVLITSTDYGTGTDSSSPIKTNIYDTDLGRASDIASTAARILAADAGTTIEMAVMFLGSYDTATCLDAASLLARLSDGDYGYAREDYDRYPPYVLFTPIPAGVILSVAMGDIVNASPVGHYRNPSNVRGKIIGSGRGRILH